jgi:hypothetical protein
VLFSLPFARTAADDPIQLNMPWLDQQNYFEGFFNGYAILDALDYLQENGERTGSEVIAVLGTRFCLPPAYDDFPDVDIDCYKRLDLTTTEDNLTEELLLRPLARGAAVYLITDDYLLPSLPDDMLVNLEPIARYDKPYGDHYVELWRATLPD